MFWIKFLLLLITGIYIIYIDVKKQIIPNKMNIFLLISGSVLAIVQYEQFLSKLSGFFIIGLIMLLLAVITKGFGLGDVKYMFNVGLILGLVQGMYALLIGFMLGGIASAVLLATKKVTLKDHIPFGPYLVIGALLSFFV